MIKNVSDDKVVDLTYHWKVNEDKDWQFCSNILRQDNEIDISWEGVKKAYDSFFMNHVGKVPYTKCPQCGCLVIPCRGKYGYFLGCQGYPECKYVVSQFKRY